MGMTRFITVLKLMAMGFILMKNLRNMQELYSTQINFKIKFDRTAKTIEIKGHQASVVNGTSPCTAPSSLLRPEVLSCVNRFYHINFNSNNGRFVFSMMAGYVQADGDTISVSYGKCDKF
jgi:hypothetical protein